MQVETSDNSVDTMVRAPQGASQDIEDFIYLISHDVRASVRALIELPQWIAEDLEEAGVPVSGSVASSIDLMNRHTGRLDRMLVDLLSFSRVGRMQEVAEVQLETALLEVMDDMKVPADFLIEYNFEHPIVTMGNRDVLTLLRALISNGIKHHDKSSGRVLLTSRRDAGAVVLSVSDNGPGINDIYHERIFAPMTTLRPRDEVEGSGMGLAVTKKIAMHYGGTTSIQSSPFGRGTQVNVCLPVSYPH